MIRIAVLVSGGGTNLQKLLESEKRGDFENGGIVLVLSSKPDVYALKRAEVFGKKTAVVNRKSIGDTETFNRQILLLLKENKIDLIVLSGFMSVLSGDVIKAYKNRIINVHCSLIPAFCGDGFYGLKVHEAALTKGVKVTGATVHFVNEVTDGGPIILQKAVSVLEGDTPESLQKRVMEQAEWLILSEAVSLFCAGRIETDGKTAKIITEDKP